MMNNKGEVGLDTVKVVMITFLVIAVIAIAGFLALVTLSDSVTVSKSGTIANETMTLVNGTGNTTSVSGLLDVGYSSVILLNATDNATIPSTNYTTSGGYIIGDSASPWLNTVVKVSLTYTYNDDSEVGSISGNYTAGLLKFFANVPTFFILLGVVIIILVIAIVIYAITRINGVKSQL